MYRCRHLLACLLLATLAPLLAQAPITLWNKTYGGSGGDMLQSIQRTVDGDFVMAGGLDATGQAGDYWLVKTNAQGDTLWTRTYGGDSYENCSSMQMTSDSGFILVGATESFGANDRNIWLVRTASNGDTLWTKTFGKSLINEANSVVQTSDSGFIVVGNTGTYDEASWDVYLIRTDTNGDTLWTKTYGGSNKEIGKSVQQTADSGYVIVANRRVNGNVDIWLLKTDANGDTTWTSTFSTGSDGEGTKVMQTADSGYAIFGIIFGTLDIPLPDGDDRDWLLIKTDSLGTLEWYQTYGGDLMEQSMDMLLTDDDGFLLSGWLDQTDLGHSADLWLVRTNSLGVTVWTTAVGGDSLDAGTGLAQIAEGEYAVAGVTNSWGAGSYDGWLVRLGAPQGTITWIGEGEDDFWENASNWDLMEVPNATGDVVIAQDGATVILPYGAPITIASLTLGDGSGEANETLQNPSGWSTAGSWLTVTGNVTIASDGYLNLRGTAEPEVVHGDSLTVGGTITNNGRINLQEESVITGNVSNNGTLEATSRECIINGNLSASATSIVKVLAGVNGYSSTLMINGNLTNGGLIKLHNQDYTIAKLNINSGTFINTGTIVDSSATFTNYYSEITTIDFDNQGTLIGKSKYALRIGESVAGTFVNSGHIHAQSSITFNNIGTFTNSGTITIDTTATLDLSGFGGAGTFVTESGEFHGNGTLNLEGMGLSLTRAFAELDSLNLVLSGTSSLTLTDSLIVYRTLTGGTITANGTRNQGTLTLGDLTSDVINNGTLILSGGTITGAITNNGTLTLSGGTITGGVINNVTLVMVGGSVTGTLVNNDSLNVSGTATITGAVTNENGGELIMNSASLSVDGGLTNNGYLLAENHLAVTNGQLVNSTTGTFSGSGTFAGDLMNEGLFEFSGSTSGGNHSNSGTFRINQGDEFTFQSGATFTNTDTIFLDATATLSISAATYQGEGGTLEGTGTLSLSSSTGHLGQKFVVKDAGVKLSINVSTIYVDSLINQTTWTVRGDTVYADSVIINQGKLILEPFYAYPDYYKHNAWYGPFINQDTLIVEPYPRYVNIHGTANEFLNGPVVNEADAVMSIQNSTLAMATLTVDSSLTNHSQLTLLHDPEATYDYQVNLNVNKGWLTNSVTGVIGALAKSEVWADLDNKGTVNVNPNIFLTLVKDPQYILNSGTINVTGGDYFEVTFLDSLVNSGTIQIDAGRTAKLYGPYVSGAFLIPEALFINDGDGQISNAGMMEIKYLTIDPGPKWVVGSTENVTLYSSRVVTDSLINEGYLTMSNASITGEVVNRDTLVATGYGAAFDSTLVNEAGAYIKGASSYSSSTYMNVDSAFTNHSELELMTTSTTSRGMYVDVKAGNLVNGPTGVINAVVGASTSASLQHKLYANLDNQGTITLSAPTLLSKVDAAHINSDTLQVDTTLTISGSGTFTNLADGIVSGKGTLDVTDVAFTNAGTIAPGGSPGVLAVAGDLTLEETSVIAIEIDEPGTGYDQLNITGEAALAGSLKVQLIDPYNPPDGTTFLPLSYGSSSGVFDTLTTQGGGTFLSAHIRDTGVYLTAGLGNSWPFIGRIADITALEDTLLAIALQTFDPDEGDVLTLNAESDITAVVLAIVEDTLKISPELNWNGTANIKVVVADPAGLKDSTEFVLTLSPVQDKPLAFDIVAPAKDSTVVINQNNLNTQFYLQWDQAEDPDGDNVYYDVVFTDSLYLLPSRSPGSYRTVYWTLSEIKTIMETKGYPEISGTWTIMARDQQDTTYAANGPLALTFVNGTLGIDGGLGIPTEFALHPAYPNPFNPSTTVRYDLPEATEVTLVIYDLLGREVIQLVEGHQEPGYRQVIWNGRTADGHEVPTGIYVARLVTPEFTRSIKLVLLK